MMRLMLFLFCAVLHLAAAAAPVTVSVVGLGEIVYDDATGGLVSVAPFALIAGLLVLFVLFSFSVYLVRYALSVIQGHSDFDGFEVPDEECCDAPEPVGGWDGVADDGRRYYWQGGNVYYEDENPSDFKVACERCDGTGHNSGWGWCGDCGGKGFNYDFSGRDGG